MRALRTTGELLEEPRRAPADVFVTCAGVEGVGRGSVASTGYLHVQASEHPRFCLGCGDQGMPDTPGPVLPVDDERDQPGAASGVLNVRNGVDCGHACERAVRFSHDDLASLVSRPVLQPHQNVVDARRVTQLVEEVCNTGCVPSVGRAGCRRHEAPVWQQKPAGQGVASAPIACGLLVIW